MINVTNNNSLVTFKEKSNITKFKGYAGFFIVTKGRNKGVYQGKLIGSYTSPKKILVADLKSISYPYPRIFPTNYTIFFPNKSLNFFKNLMHN